MRYTVCIIDDKIPAQIMDEIREFDLLNASILQILLKDEASWTDLAIRNLVQKLLGQTDTDGTPRWNVYGFTNPRLFIDTLNEGLFRADLVVFDWDYPVSGSGMDSESLLKEILDRTFALVFIFSNADKEHEVDEVRAKPEFQEYKERLEYLDKATNGDDQTEALLRKAEQMYASNFSFKFASELRKIAVQTVDKILSDMGRASLNDVKNYIVVGEGGKKDFVDFLAERFRTTAAGKDIHDLVDQIPETPAGTSMSDKSLAKKVWSYRLYFHRESGDDLVRRGDIVKKDGIFYFVISADCDLGYFWRKNLGIINTVTLHELDKSNSSLKEWLTLCVKPEKLSGKVSSLLGRIGELSDGPFALPFVPVGAETKNFIVVPKDLVSQRIGLPPHWDSLTEREKKEDSMRYAYWSGAEKVCTVSEPFLTPVIQHILNIISGYGVPDYPEQMREILKGILGDFSSPTPSTGKTT